MLNWIVWIKTAWLNWRAWCFWQLNCVLMLNWIVWNRTILIKMDLALNNLQRLICHKTQTTNQPTIIYVDKFAGRKLAYWVLSTCMAIQFRNLEKWPTSNNKWPSLYIYTTYVYSYLHMHVCITYIINTSVMTVLLYGGTTWKKCIEKKLDGNYIRMLWFGFFV